MEKEEGITDSRDFRRALSEPILHGTNIGGTSRSGTCITTLGYFGPGSQKPSVSSLLIILYRHCRNELYIELAARPTGEDLHTCQEEICFLTYHLEHLHRLTEKQVTFLKQNP